MWDFLFKYFYLVLFFCGASVITESKLSKLEKILDTAKKQGQADDCRSK